MPETDMPEMEILLAELDRWSAAGLTARFWWRDDDAVAATPQLDRLLELARRFNIGAALAVVPSKADDSLVKALRDTNIVVWQHGWSHAWHAKGEFGEGRAVEALIADALRGRAALDARFGPAGWQPVFVPPHHSLAMPFKRLLPILDYYGVSLGELGDGYRPTPELATLAQCDTEVDIVDWAGPIFIGDAAACRALARRLELRRIGLIPRDLPIGLLTHHLIHGDDVWAFLERLFADLRAHSAVAFVAARSLFHPGAAIERQMPAPPDNEGKGQVTVVVTSCNRFDLLQRTLDSFFQHNAFPVRRVVVIEDGPPPAIDALKARYADRPMVWADTGERVGQIRAADMAYRLVDTEYVFHLEDDWEFTRGGFIENSIRILKRHREILQVWIRSYDELGRYPRVAHRFDADGAPFYLVADAADEKRKWLWSGFSFNPGLHRMADYRRIGAYGSVDPLNEKLAAEVEHLIGLAYRGLGFHGAMLDDHDGAGYVTHIGEGRHVPEPVQQLYAPTSFRQHLKDLIPSLIRAIRWRLDRTRPER